MLKNKNFASLKNSIFNKIREQLKIVTVNKDNDTVQDIYKEIRIE